jgi:predicted MPP superfamily phosphohydrolase
MGLIGLDLIRLSHRIRPWYPEILKKHWNTVKLSLFFVFVFSITGLMIKAYHNAIYPAVRHVHIHIPKEVAGKDRLTIAMMSDIHIGEYIGKKQVQRFVELCNAEHPDLVLIGGDFMDHEVRRAEKEFIEEDLQRLNAPLGVYIVLGNHEYRANRYAKIRWFEKTGGILLIDSVVMPDSTFYLIGRDEILNGNRASLETLMQGVDTAKPVIVLEHRPTFARDVIDNQCDLGLYGHTHNCQYWPFSYFLRFIFEFPYGYYKVGNSHINVTSGIGFTGPPFRMGTRSELVVLHITFGRA